MNSPGPRSRWLSIAATDTPTPGATAAAWALTRSVSCSRSRRWNGRTSIGDMAGLLDGQVGTREPLPVRYGSNLAADGGACHRRDPPSRPALRRERRASYLAVHALRGGANPALPPSAARRGPGRPGLDDRGRAAS